MCSKKCAVSIPLNYAVCSKMLVVQCAVSSEIEVCIVYCAVWSKMLVVQWGAIYHPRRHTCPFVTIPNSPSSSSSSISIQHFNKSQKSINDDTEGQGAGHIHDNCIQQYFRLEIFVKEIIWPQIFLDQVILAASNIWLREHLHGMPQCLDLGTMGEFWVNVVTARKAGVAIVHVHTKLCNCVQFTIMHNCELHEIVRAGLELCTHTMQLHHPAPSHVSLLFLIYQLFICSIQQGFYVG